MIFFDKLAENLEKTNITCSCIPRIFTRNRRFGNTNNYKYANKKLIMFYYIGEEPVTSQWVISIRTDLANLSTCSSKDKWSQGGLWNKTIIHGNVN